MAVKQYQTASNVYKHIRNIGNGGAGHVHEVKDLDGSVFALKVLDANSASRDKLKRFMNEMKYCEHSRNEAIVSVLDDGYFIENGLSIPFYIMPRYECSLRDLMKGEYGLEKIDIAKLVIAMFEGIARFHSEGNYHRDIKPENILFDKERSALVLADFGTAHLIEQIPGATVLTKKSDRLANFVYAAPEQRAREAQTDNRTDIFALGLILNEVFTGEVPQGSAYALISESAPEFGYLDDVVELMIKQSMGDRYQSLDEVLRDIEARKRDDELKASLEALRNKKIERDSETDSFVSDPIRLTGSQWKDGTLYFELSKQPNATWIRAFKSHPEDYFDTMGFQGGPKHFDVDGYTVVVKKVRDSESRIKEVVSKMPGYIEHANSAYRELITQEKADKEKAAIESKKKAIEEKELEERMNRLLLDPHAS